MLKGEKVVLRAWEEHDALLYYEGLNSLAFRFLEDTAEVLPVSLDKAKEYISSYGKHEGETGFNFAVLDKNQKLIGSCCYKNLSLKNRTAWVAGGVFSPDDWGKGYGSDFFRVLISYLFEEMNLRKIFLDVFAFNERAVKLYKKLGFTEEGRLKECVYRSGEYHDELIMGLKREDFKLTLNFFQSDLIPGLAHHRR